jgi:hypothetical protein
MIAALRISRRFALIGAALAVLVTSLCAGYAGQALARSLEDKEKTALASTVNEFNAAMQNKAYDRVAATVPPKVLASIAKKAGADPEEVRYMMVDLMKKMMGQVTLETFSMDLPAAQYKETPGGQPYALIPTNTIVSLGAKGRFSEKSFTLGLLDDGKWYLVRISDAAHLLTVRDVYPDFTSVEFPQGSMEVLKQ